MQAYTASGLWGRTLAPETDDRSAEARERLRGAYKRMRDTIAPLVDQVHDDCPGLTVHDITHLDALWEMADRIIGPSYPVTPIEAFAFGIAVLIHDAGMALAAFPGGLAELRRKPEWLNAVVVSLRG